MNREPSHMYSNPFSIFTRSFLEIVKVSQELAYRIDRPQSAGELPQLKEAQSGLSAFCNRLGAYGVRLHLFDGTSGRLRAEAYETLAAATGGDSLATIRANINNYKALLPWYPISPPVIVPPTERELLGVLVGHKALTQKGVLPFILIAYLDRAERQQLPDLDDYCQHGRQALGRGYIGSAPEAALLTAAYNVTSLSVGGPLVHRLNP